MTKKPSLQEIERAISGADAGKQARILRDLPKLLKIAPADMAFLKAAERSFGFWNNADDAIYDQL